MYHLLKNTYHFISAAERLRFEQNMLKHYCNECRLDNRPPVLNVKDIGITSYFYDFCMTDDDKDMLGTDNSQFLIDRYQQEPDFQNFLEDVQLFYTTQQLTFRHQTAKGGFSCVMH